jgi:hypothetical protein
LTLHSLRDRSLYVAPIRLGLGVLWLAAARLAGAPSTGGLLAFAGGTFFTVLALFNDPRAAFLRREEPRAAPLDAQVATPVQQALRATIPSTFGLSVLAAMGLVFQPTLTSVLGGVSAGLGIAGVLYALRADPALYVDPRNGVVYRRS